MLGKANLTTLVVLLSAALTAAGQSLLTDHTFQVPVFFEEDGKKRLGVQFIHGDERKNNSMNRLSMISENQMDYPEPESGCAPIAMLNILVWYQKYGLIEPLFRASDSPAYKSKLFHEIDRRILEKSGTTRTETGGTSTQDTMVVMDELVNQQSSGRVRMHANYYAAPLQLKDLLDSMPNFRAGYVVGQPIDPETGELMSSHGMALIRADRAGFITLASWGEKYRGLLRMRNGKQIFVPQDPDHFEIQISGFYRFIPFQPTSPGDR